MKENNALKLTNCRHRFIRQKIPIVFATNENYAPYAAVAITSLIKNSSRLYYYDIYVFFTELGNSIIDAFHEMKGDNYRVSCMDVNSYIDSAESLYENFHFSKEMYYRLLIPSILSDYDKVLYLDSDIVVLHDISALYNISLDGYAIGGIKDIMHQCSKNYVTENLKIPADEYINSGILLINCSIFKEMHIKDKCFELLSSSKIKFRYPDQDIINICCRGFIKYIDQSWNYIWHYNFPRYNQSPDLLLSPEEMNRYNEYKKDIKILHYTSNVKPWNNYNTELSKYFFRYVTITEPFKEIIYERYNALALKNYVVLQFFDKKDDMVVITGAFYSIEDYLYRDKIIININGSHERLKYDFSRNLDIRNQCYRQNFFKLNFTMQDCINGIEFIFSREGREERLPIFSGKHFPLDVELGSRIFFNECSLSVKNKIGTIKKETPQSITQYRKYINLRLLCKLGKRGKKAWFVRKIYYLTKPFFKKETWLISDRISAAGDNGEVFFDFVNNQNDGIKSYFIIRKGSSDFQRIKKKGCVVSPGSIKFYLLFLHCTANISSQFEYQTVSPYNTAYLKDLWVNRKNVFLQHGVTKDDISRAYSRFEQNMNFFVTTAKREAESIIRNPNYGLDQDNILLSGFPRFDKLQNNKKKIVCVFPTWRKEVQNKINSKISAYDTAYYRNYHKFLTDEKLIGALKKHGYKLVFIPHPLIKEIFSQETVVSDVIHIQTGNVDYQKIFEEAAILVTDYSSTAFDFAYLKKPVLYYQFDKDTIYSSHTYNKGYFQYENDGFGEVVTDGDSLIELLEKYLRLGCAMKPFYYKRVETFFEFFDRNNCRRLYDILLETTIGRKKSLMSRFLQCYREHGFVYTAKRIKAKLTSKEKAK